MFYDLPTSVVIEGVTYDIRSDYRAALDICAALSNAELTERERTAVALDIFYPDFDTMPQEHYGEAVRECLKFLNGGEDPQENKRSPRLIDWEQDFPYIVAPVNRVLGTEIRAAEYLHWFSFISAYMEIGGDCTFAQIVGIRSKMSRGKRLDKPEREWMRHNRRLVEFRKKYTDAENDLMKQWGVG